MTLSVGECIIMDGKRVDRLIGELQEDRILHAGLSIV